MTALLPDLLPPSTFLTNADLITPEWYDWLRRFRAAVPVAPPTVTNYAHSTFLLAEKICSDLGTPLVNDNGVSDQNAKLQSAINFVAAQRSAFGITGGGRLQLPPWTIGCFGGGNPLKVPSGITLVGQGQGQLYRVGVAYLDGGVGVPHYTPVPPPWMRTAWGTKLKNVGPATGGPGIWLTNGDTNLVQAPGVENLTIDMSGPDWRSTPGSSSGAPNASHRIAILQNNNWGCTIRNVDICFAGEGIRSEVGTAPYNTLTVTSHYENVRIGNVYNGIVINGSPPGTAVADSRFYHVYVWDAERAALDVVRHSDNVYHFGCDYRANGPGSAGAGAILFNSSNESAATTAVYHTFYGCECVGAAKPSQFPNTDPGWPLDQSAAMVINQIGNHSFAWDGHFPVGGIIGAGVPNAWFRFAGQSMLQTDFSLWTGNVLTPGNNTGMVPAAVSTMIRIDMTDFCRADLGPTYLPLCIKKAQVYLRWKPDAAGDVAYITNPDTHAVMASVTASSNARQEIWLDVLPWIIANNYYSNTNAGFQLEYSNVTTTGPSFEKCVLRIKYTNI